MVTLIIALLATAANVSPYTSLCSVGELRRSPGYVWRVERIADLVDSAHTVVRAVATSADSAGETVQFRGVEWLRGDSAGGPLVLPGRVVTRDDFNAGTVPYQIVRRAGQHGDCFAREYRIGAEYLFLLRRGPRGYNIHWWPLAPLNEQVRGADDPWVAWVRARIQQHAAPSR